MSSGILTQNTLEEFYQKVILPQFGVVGKVVWCEHLVIDADSEAHIFACNTNKFALVFDDHPSTNAQSLALELPFYSVHHVSLVANSESSLRDSDRYVLRFGPTETPFHYVPNVTGYFQLLEIKT